MKRRTLALICLALAPATGWSVGAIANAPRNRLNATLLSAVLRNDPKAVRTLLRDGADPNTERPAGFPIPRDWRDWQRIISSSKSRAYDPNPVVIEAIHRRADPEIVSMLL